MNRAGMAVISIVWVIFFLGCAPVREAPIKPVEPADQLVREFAGDAPAPTRSPGQLEGAYAAVIESLLPGMGADAIPDREVPQQSFERICLRAGRPGAEAERAALCRAMVARLGPETAKPVRVWLLWQLERMSGKESVVRLAELLDDKDPHIHDAARRALQNNSSAQAGTALRAALSRAKEPAWQVAIINALGARGEQSHVGAIAAMAKSKDRGVALAAVAALGDLGGFRALRTLKGLRRARNVSLHESATDSLIRVADRLVQTGRSGQAVSLYEDIYATGLDRGQRIAALRGLAAAQGERALPKLCQAIRDPADPMLQCTAVRIAQEIPGEAAAKALIGEVAGAPTDVGVVLLDALALREERSAKPTVLEAIQSKDAAVRVAALRALKPLGDQTDVLRLAQAAAGADGEERKAARESLDRLRGNEVDPTILEAVSEQTEPKVRCELIRSLAERRYRAAVKPLLATAKDQDETVRVAAFNTLEKLAGDDDLAVLVELLVNEKQDKAREAAEDAIVAVSMRIEDRDRRADTVLAAAGKANGAVKASLIRVLGRVQGPAPLAAVREAMKDADADVVDAAVRGLAKWESAEVLDDLLGIAREGKDQAHRVLALRGYVRLVRLPSDRPAIQTLQMLQGAMGLAQQDEDRKLVLGALGDIAHAGALGWARSYLDTEALRNEAATAVVSIAKKLGADETEAVLAALEQVVKAGVGDEPRKGAQERLDLINRFKGYLGTWEVAGPYFREGKRASEVFEIAFDPETSPTGGDWKPLTFRRDDSPWIFNLKKLDEGGDRCVYVRGRVWSEAERPARLEIGSDDGVKAWLNGKPVHAKFVHRGVNPGEDKVDVTLQRGENVLLLKIVQIGGDWGFCCGVRDRDGKPIQDLRYRAEMPRAGGVVVRLYDVGQPMRQLPDLLPDEAPNVAKVLPTLDLSAGPDGFGEFENQFMTQATGFIAVARSGKHTFRLVSDDGAKLWVDGKLVVNHDGQHGADPKDGDVELTAGDHPFRVLYFQDGGDKRLALLWKPVDAADFVVVPADCLTHGAGEVLTTAPGKKQVVMPLRRGRPGDGAPLAGPHPGFERGEATADVKLGEELSAGRLRAFDRKPTGGMVVAWLPTDDGQESFSSAVVIPDGPHSGQAVVLTPRGESKRLCVENVGHWPQGCAFRFGVNPEPVKPSGQLAFEMLVVRAMANGMEIEFTQPLDSRVGWERESYYVEQWPFDPARNTRPLRDGSSIPVKSASVSSDRKRVFLEIEGLKESCLVYLRLLPPCVSEDGRLPWSTEAWYTLNLIPKYQPGEVLPPPPQEPQNILTQAEKDAGWRLLFDGRTTDGWRGFRKDTFPGDGWKAIDGCLVRVGPGGDIITKEQFDNFELAMEWRICAGGNSGIFFRVAEDADAVFLTGPEMQVLDNAEHADGRNPKTSAGSSYALYAPTKDTTVPVGMFNQVRILADGNHIEYWLNDVKVVEYELESPEWEKLIAESKFQTMPRHGRVKKGHIAVQDHGDRVWYRNIKIRPLSAAGDGPNRDRKGADQTDKERKP